MNKIKLIITDLDNTLLRRDKTISQYTKSVFERLKSKGVLVAFATARSEKQCKRFSDMLNPYAIISNGGARVRISDKTIHRATIDTCTTNKLLSALSKLPSVKNIGIDTDSGYFVNRQPEEELTIDLQDFLPVSMIDFSKEFKYGAYKMPIECFNSDDVYKVASNFPSIEVMKFSGEDWFCFMDKNATKLNGIKALANHMGIGLENVIAFGDDFNDIEMIEKCGTSVAAGNAIDEVKNAAGYICNDCDNDGVAKFIEEKFLGRRKYLGHVNKRYIKDFKTQIIRVDEDNISGYAAFIKIKEVHCPQLVGEKGSETCIADNGYSELCYLPDNENWQFYAMYDNQGCIIEWYFDITRKNAISETGEPYADDMYLDAVLMPSGKIMIFDEDELLEARDNGNISQEEFNIAYSVLNRLIDSKVISVNFMEKFCSRLLSLFK